MRAFLKCAKYFKYVCGWFYFWVVSIGLWMMRMVSAGKDTGKTFPHHTGAANEKIIPPA
jgi:hypothetical protein